MFMSEEIKKNENGEATEELENSMYVPESFEDDFDSGSSTLIGTQYDVPEDATTLIDAGEGKVVNKEDLTPFEIIKTIAKENGFEVLNPNPSCKCCNGRGYDGIESTTKMPIPCNCIYPKKTPVEKESEDYQDMKSAFITRKPNHKMKRNMALALKSQMRKIHKIQKRMVDSNEVKEDDKRFINKFVKKYIELASIKKTAEFFELTKTQAKNLIKDNREKIEKTKLKLKT